MDYRELLRTSFVIRYASRKLRAFRYRKLSRQEVFKDIYQRNAWGSAESVSGPGSDLEQTKRVREVIPQLLQRFRVGTFLDASCGDFHWMSQVEFGDVSYIGADIVPELIAENQKRYGRPGREFVHRDIAVDPLPRADFVLCRDCLMHLGWNEIFKALANIQATGAGHVLITTFVNTKRNADIGAGGSWPMNLQLAPFFLPPPMELFTENPPSGEARASGKSLGLWPCAALSAALSNNGGSRSAEPGLKSS